MPQTTTSNLNAGTAGTRRRTTGGKKQNRGRKTTTSRSGAGRGLGTRRDNSAIDVANLSPREQRILDLGYDMGMGRAHREQLHAGPGWRGRATR